MYIKLDLESDKPIYTQLVEQIIAGIARADLLPGERLPSVRAMAADIGINLHTVNKAYQQLRAEGFILIHRQRGVIVNPDGPPAPDAAYLAELQANLAPLIANARARGLSAEAFEQQCATLFATYSNKAGETND